MSSKTNLKQNQWQAQLLPFMIAMIVGLTVVFFVLGIWLFVTLNSNIPTQAPTLESLPEIFELAKSENVSLSAQSSNLALAQLRVQTQMEEYILKQRYHHANVALISRNWFEFIGFSTGVMLALIGAAFILGKLREAPAEIDATVSALLRISIVTSSPGIILSLLGTVLIATTMMTHQPISVKDGSVYLPKMANNLPFVTSTPSTHDLANDKETKLKESGVVGNALTSASTFLSATRPVGFIPPEVVGIDSWSEASVTDKLGLIPSVTSREEVEQLLQGGDSQSGLARVLIDADELQQLYSNQLPDAALSLKLADPDNRSYIQKNYLQDQELSPQWYTNPQFRAEILESAVADDKGKRLGEWLYGDPTVLEDYYQGR